LRVSHTLTLQTLQEIGTMLRRGVHPYLFVLNNDGYEIERQIHGEKAQYNDIQMYDHQALLPFLAGKKSKVSQPPVAGLSGRRLTQGPV
jgi:pyruvate decarboxylase